MYKNFILTESEKEEILNMHKSYGYKNVVNEVAEEPVIGDNKKAKVFGTFYFDEGKTSPKVYRNAPVTPALMGYLAKQMADYLKSTGAVDTLHKFRNSPDFRIPQFIEIHLRTSQTGSGETNSSVADGRKKFLDNLIVAAFKLIGMDAAVAKAVIMNKPETTYSPTQMDTSFYDPKLSEPNAMERTGWIVVKPLQTQGNSIKGIQNIQKGLNSASSMLNTWLVDGVDETRIIQELSKLKSFSDIEDISNSINAGGKWYSLEDFLNDQLSDDSKQMQAVAVILQRLAMRSQKQKNTVRIVGGKISIGLE